MTLRHRIDPLVGKGLVGYDPPTAEVWPESGVHGKKPATLRQVPTHTVGVPAVPGGIGPTGLAGRPQDCAAIAGTEPRWRPGIRTGYRGPRRVTGRSVRRVQPHDRVAASLEIVGELYFGVPPAELARLEDAAPHPAEPAEHGSILAP
jgi:Beta-lactamase